MTERDIECQYKDLCEKTYGENGSSGFMECPSYDECLHPYNEFSEGEELNG